MEKKGILEKKLRKGSQMKILMEPRPKFLLTPNNNNKKDGWKERKDDDRRKESARRGEEGRDGRRCALRNQKVSVLICKYLQKGQPL